MVLIIFCRKEFEHITEGLSDALGFTQTIGVGMDWTPYEKGGSRGTLGEVDFYTRSVYDLLSLVFILTYDFHSHEGLMLNYEEAMTRESPLPASLLPPEPKTSKKSVSPAKRPTGFYNTGAHFIWIGDRTRQLDGAHVEYFKGIRNPIGIKVGPSMENEELVRLLNSEWSECIRWARRFSNTFCKLLTQTRTVGGSLLSPATVQRRSSSTFLDT